jgi:hypothetical protein
VGKLDLLHPPAGYAGSVPIRNVDGLREAVKAKFELNDVRAVDIELFYDKNSQQVIDAALDTETRISPRTLIAELKAFDLVAIVPTPGNSIDKVDSISGTTSHDVQNKAFLSYVQRARKLMAHDSVQRVRNKLLEITSKPFPEGKEIEDYNLTAPFVFLQGSSGKGKTQMAFNIQEALGAERKVFYLLFHAAKSEGAQQVYQNFVKISTLFQSCHNRDLSNESHPESPTCRVLVQRKLFVFGFIYEMISSGITKESVTVEARTGYDVFQLMKSKGLDNQRPVFIIDECLAITKETGRTLRFVRNCFRALGIGLVLLGTDSSVTRLPLSTGESSRDGDASPWCFIYGSFPPVTASSLGLPRMSPYNELLEHSRPWFAVLMAQNLTETNDFEKALRLTSKTVLSKKSIFQTDHGRYGQIRLFYNAYYPISHENIAAGIIHQHFAELDSDKDFVLMNDGTYNDTKNPWVGDSRFPLIGHDTLLYLLLMGGKDVFAFCDKYHRPLPYGAFFTALRVNSDYNCYSLDTRNAQQSSNSGMELEALLATIVCLSSHSNGISGIAPKDFIREMVYQLQIGVVNREDVHITEIQSVKWPEATIPFLSPPNMAWPKFLRGISNAKFGNLKRVQDTEMVDFLTDCGVYGESKDYRNRIDLRTMRSILKRIPDSTKIGIVFTRQLQDTYYSKDTPTFADEFAGTYASKLQYLKLDTRCSNETNYQFNLEPITGLPAEISTTGVVIFFLVTEKLKMDYVTFSNVALQTSEKKN